MPIAGSIHALDCIDAPTHGYGRTVNEPVSPPPVTDDGGDHLPAYVSNGVVGLRVLSNPLRPGFAVLNGLAAIHPVRGIEDSPQAPYPVAGDIAVGGVRLSHHPEAVEWYEQRYDFSCGELHSSLRAVLDGRRISLEVLTFASRSDPTVVVQEVTVSADRRCELTVTARVSTDDVPGELVTRAPDLPRDGEIVADGSLKFTPPGDLCRVGVAYATELIGPRSSERSTADWFGSGDLATSYRFEAEPSARYRLRQFASLVPSDLHSVPEVEAARLAGAARHLGFDALRDRNRAIWNELWRGRPVLCDAPSRWQALADAAHFYLQSSVHPSSHSSTSIFGLARWYDYHYYYGHVMWDIEAFSVPPLILTQPDAARALLGFRARTALAAQNHARLLGRRGMQFPWEAGPKHGEEAAPLGGLAAAHEDHVSLVVAQAFAQYAYTTGDVGFAEEDGWRITSGVAEWVCSRVRQTDRGFEIERALGVAERPAPENNNAYVNMGAVAALRHAIVLGELSGNQVPGEWREIADGLVLPIDDNGVILDHDGFDPSEEKAETPSALAGLTLFGHPVPPDVEAATLQYYLDRADEYIGSPMLASLLGVWAARTGDRRRSAELFEEGYAAYCDTRFHNVHEYRPDRFPDEPVAGPFFANLSGFILGCLLALPRLRIGPGEPSSWSENGPIVMPQTWTGIEVERIWVRGEPHRLEAEHGAERARLVPQDG